MPGRDVDATLDRLRTLLRPASIATVGGFRPPADPRASVFFRGVGLPDETAPVWHGEAMPPVLTIRVDELPVVPPRLSGIALLVFFHNIRQLAFDRPMGEGWSIRSYRTLDGLMPLPPVESGARSFPVRWHRVDDDAPGWDDAWSLLDLTAVDADEAASDRFLSDFTCHDGTKIGGYPTSLQGEVGIDDFAFQVDSEQKTGWMWGDRGVAHVHRDDAGGWRLSGQFL